MDTFFYHVLPVVTCILLNILVWIIVQWKRSAKRGTMPFCTSCSGHKDCSTASQKKCLEKWQWHQEWGLFIKWSVVIILCCAIFWVLMWLSFRTSTPVGNKSEAKTWIEAGTFGDMFGFLTCLFSGLAFSGIIISIRQQNHNLALQRQAIKLQIQEMRATRKVSEAQTEQLLAQAQIAKEQNMDIACFEYLKYLDNRKAAIDIIQKNELRIYKCLRIEELNPNSPFDYINKLRRIYTTILKEEDEKETGKVDLKLKYTNGLNEKQIQCLKERICFRIQRQLQETGTWYRIIMNYLERIVVTYKRKDKKSSELRKRYSTSFLLIMSQHEQRSFRLYSHLSQFSKYHASEQYNNMFLTTMLKYQPKFPKYLPNNEEYTSMIKEIIRDFFQAHKNI